jgi:hypothetical protein
VKNCTVGADRWERRVGGELMEVKDWGDKKEKKINVKIRGLLSSKLCHIFSLLSFLREKMQPNEITTLSVSVCPPSHQLLNQLVGFYEIQKGGHAIEGDLDAIIFNAVAAAVPKWQTFKLAPLNVRP